MSVSSVRAVSANSVVFAKEAFVSSSMFEKLLCAGLGALSCYILTARCNVPRVFVSRLVWCAEALRGGAFVSYALQSCEPVLLRGNYASCSDASRSGRRPIM